MVSGVYLESSFYFCRFRVGDLLIILLFYFLLVRDIDIARLGIRLGL